MNNAFFRASLNYYIIYSKCLWKKKKIAEITKHTAKNKTYTPHTHISSDALTISYFIALWFQCFVRWFGGGVVVVEYRLRFAHEKHSKNSLLFREKFASAIGSDHYLCLHFIFLSFSSVALTYAPIFRLNIFCVHLPTSVRLLIIWFALFLSLFFFRCYYEKFNELSIVFDCCIDCCWFFSVFVYGFCVEKCCGSF